MSIGWYYSTDSSKAGPMSVEEIMRLVADGSQPDALVWREGLRDWQRPQDVPELTRATRRRGVSVPASARPRQRWSLRRAAVVGLVIGAISFAISEAADGGEDLSVWLGSGRIGEIIGYVGGRILAIPMVFVMVALVLNLFQKIRH